LLGTLAGDFISGKDDELIALKFFEDGELGAHFVEEHVALR
jgi:hypothetical protein